MKDIEEMIADARAEEEVAKEMVSDNSKDNFREMLRESLKEAFKPKDGVKVSIDLREYVTLVNKSMDLDRILSAITDNLRLSYNDEYLSLTSDNNVVEAFKVLYPEAYDHYYEYLLENKEAEGE